MDKLAHTNSKTRLAEYRRGAEKRNYTSSWRDVKEYRRTFDTPNNVRGSDGHAARTARGV